MINKLRLLVKENGENEKFKLNNASVLAKQIGLSRNWTSQYLNECFSSGEFIKINTRPVVFIDKKTIEEKYQIVINKPLLSSFEELRQIIRKHDKSDFQKLVGHNGSLRDVVDKCKASISYPPNGLPTLFYGPTGTGKSTIAQYMYEYGVNKGILNKEAKFVHVNCSEYANNPELITANLFGYKKGAFTGADNDNFGMINTADGGILFLDEVHCLRPECQEKLFLFMDKGNYRMLGDSEHIYHSNVLLLFATTEDPETALLKTLLRRIPIRIEIPSLEERGIKEKSQILVEALDKEAKKIKKELLISNIAYNTLLNARYSGNVGEMFNVVQATCMNALFRNKDEQCLKIQMLNLPDSIISNYNIHNNLVLSQYQMLHLHDLKKNMSEHIPYAKLFETLLNNLNDFKNDKVSLEFFIEQCSEDLAKHFNTIVFDENNVKSLTNAFVMNVMKSVIEIISNKYGYSFQDNEVYIISMIVRDCSQSYIELEEYMERHKYDCQLFVSIIESNFMREYSLVSEMNDVLHIRLDTNLQPFIIAIITLVLHMYHKNRDINKRIGIILAHGYATASSIANAVNQMLDQYIFDAVDMPIDSTTEMILGKLKEFLNRRGEYHDLILLVDMGSLEDIYKGILDICNANIAIINNVNTKMALVVGEALRNNVSLKNIIEKCKENSNISYHFVEGKTQEKIILCSCATGMGTAEKLKHIIEDSLPKKLPVKVLTYDYTTLLEKKMEDEFFERYEVVCIVGTLNPNIENIKFIPVEELIMNNTFETLTIHFKDLINEDDEEQFRKNIIKNFSLSNIIGNLTILNPDKLLHHVADAIDRLQKEMNMMFSYNVCFGLYVHICCLIERLVTREGAENYEKTYEECSVEMKMFIKQIKKAFSKVEKYYSVSIPIEEIEYIDIYIKNMR